MDVGQWIVIGISALLGVWYVAAGTFNRRRGIASYHWLKEGLEAQGKLTGASWIGSSGSGARLVVGQARQPFRRIEVVFLLETREILPLWLFNRARGKRDELILKATLRKVPTLETEVAQAADRGFPAQVKEDASMTLIPAPGLQGFQLAVGRSADAELSAGLEALLTQYPTAILRLSLRRSQPHLILRVNLMELQTQGPSEAFFDHLSGWVTGGDGIESMAA